MYCWSAPLTKSPLISKDVRMRKLVLMLALSCLPVLRADAQTVTLSGHGTLLDGRLP